MGGSFSEPQPSSSGNDSRPVGASVTVGAAPPLEPRGTFDPFPPPPGGKFPPEGSLMSLSLGINVFPRWLALLFATRSALSAFNARFRNSDLHKQARLALPRVLERAPFGSVLQCKSRRPRVTMRSRPRVNGGCVFVDKGKRPATHKARVVANTTLSDSRRPIDHRSGDTPTRAPDRGGVDGVLAKN